MAPSAAACRSRFMKVPQSLSPTVAAWTSADQPAADAAARNSVSGMRCDGAGACGATQRQARIAASSSFVRAIFLGCLPADDLEHIGGLLQQRLAQLAKQSRVLDGDDGLARKVRDQLDLFFGEWPYFLTKNDDRANKPVLLEHAHSD